MTLTNQSKCSVQALKKASGCNAVDDAEPKCYDFSLCKQIDTWAIHKQNFFKNRAEHETLLNELVARLQRGKANSAGDLDGEALKLESAANLFAWEPNYDDPNLKQVSKLAKDGCGFAIAPIEDYSSRGEDALPNKPTKWIAGAIKKGEKFSDEMVCLRVPLALRETCREDFRRKRVYFTPDSIPLKSDDGKMQITVYGNGSAEGVFGCIKNSSFELPLSAGKATENKSTAAALK